METIDDEIFEVASEWLDRKTAEDNPFFMWFNTSHMHFRTHPKPESLGQLVNPQHLRNWFANCCYCTS